VRSILSDATASAPAGGTSAASVPAESAQLAESSAAQGGASGASEGQLELGLDVGSRKLGAVEAADKTQA
jgi:hypothetical protein